jgi:hypothetical protein
MADFVIVGCHANRASEASVTLRHLPSGALVSVHHVPFEHDYSESADAECDRIQRTAAQIAQAAAVFLTAQSETRTVSRDDAVRSPTGHPPSGWRH